MTTTRELITTSIEHWRELHEQEQPQTRMEANQRAIRPIGPQCALCQAFSGCSHCPIRTRTGHKACDETPYNAAYEAFFEQKGDWKSASMAEIKFLESLLEDYPEDRPNGKKEN